MKKLVSYLLVMLLTGVVCVVSTNHYNNKLKVNFVYEQVGDAQQLANYYLTNGCNVIELSDSSYALYNKTNGELRFTTTAGKGSCTYYSTKQQLTTAITSYFTAHGGNANELEYYLEIFYK